MKIDQPDYFPPADFTTADEAVDRLKQIYDLSISFLKNAFSDITTSMKGGIKYRAFYPEISIKIDRFAQIDSLLVLVTSHNRGIMRQLLPALICLKTI